MQKMQKQQQQEIEKQTNNTCQIFLPTKILELKISNAQKNYQ